MQPYLQLPLVPHTPVTGEGNGAAMTGLGPVPQGLGRRRERKWILLINSLIAQLVKNLPAIQETLVQFLGQEDPLVKG